MLASRTVQRAARPAFLTPEAELRRLDAHFRRVLARLHRAPAAGLGPAQRRARARHLEELERYRRAGRFPRNRLFPGMLLPHFIDAEGTRCAMGHLIEQAGGADLVHHVARARNYARIRELADIKELLLWLEANGLTVEEAALIQPSYCSTASSCLCLNHQAQSLLEGTLDLGAGDNLIVSAAYGPDVGIAAGDTVPINLNGAAVADGAHVLAGASSTNTWFRYLIDNAEAVTTESCNFEANPPGPLPKQVLIDSLISDSEAACEAVLEAHDPAWIEEQGGGCSNGSSTSTGTGTGTGTGAGGGTGSGGAGGGTESPGDDGGCSFRAGSATSVEAAFALFLGACLLHRVRRVTRATGR